MKQILRRGASLLLAVVMLLGLSATAFAADEVGAVLSDTGKYLYDTVRDPQVGSVGGEWAVLGLARSGYAVPEKYFQNYYKTVEKYVKACGGVLHEKKYTEYSRVIAALSAIGKDARDVAGYDLTVALGDFEKTIWQGLNGPIWALIALDSANYPMPENKSAATQATRQMYIDEVLDRQLADGGWSLTGRGGDRGPSDPDITGMALQALAKYQDQPAVAKATGEALDCMSGMQNKTGGIYGGRPANSESCVQMIVGLCELGISLDDPRFVKNGNTLLDALMTFYQPGSGFLHTTNGTGSNGMATEQGFYALTAVQRVQNGQSNLYRMDDALQLAGNETARQPGTGLPGRNEAVQAVPVKTPGKTFEDISGHINRSAIEALAARGIINGKTEETFDPDASMTRAEFSAIVVRALGLAPKAADAFTDVSGWSAPYVGTAYTFGIVNGVGGGRFDPTGTITRQEAAIMVARTAKLCGMDTARNAAAVRDMLAQFSDYTQAVEWARESLAFCYDAGILDQSALTIQPRTAIRRCEIAQMICNLLERVELL